MRFFDSLIMGEIVKDLKTVKEISNLKQIKLWMAL